MIRAFRAAIPIFVFWIGLLAGRMLSGKEPGNSLTLPDRPSPLSPITISIQGSSVYALYWTKVGANFQLRLAALDFEKRSVRKVDIAVEPQVSGLHQSIVAVPAQQSLALFYSLGTSGSTVSGRLTAVKLADLSISGQRKLDSLTPLSHWMWLEPGIGDQPTLLGHPFGRESSLAVCRVDVPEMACKKAHDVPLSAQIGTFASARGQMLWYTPYGLTRPKQKTTITGLRFENDNQVVTATVPVGQYLSGLQASNHGLLVTINQGDPQSSRATPSLLLLDDAGRELTRHEIDADCAIGLPIASGAGVGVANCVRMKRGFDDQYYVDVDKLVAYRINPDNSLTVRVVESPTKDLATAGAFANDTSGLHVVAVDTNGTVSVIN